MPFTIAGTLICFYLYYYFAGSYLAKRLFKNSPSGKDQIRIFLFKKISGFFFMGVIPLIFYKFFISGTILSDFGLRFSDLWSNILKITGLSLLVVIFVFLVSKLSGPEEDKPQIHQKTWTKKLFLVNCLGWILYLTGYEFLFRGVFLISCYNHFGFWVAIAINLSVYSAIHMVNGIREALGALVFGLIVCILTLRTGTILISMVMHIVLALSTDYFAIRYRTDMQFVKNTHLNR